LIDKPLGWTSFDVVNKVRHKLKKKLGLKKLKVGHAGTLDPLATGLLILCVGDYTKQIDTIQGQPKEYIGVLTFGATTPSYDLEKPPDQFYPTGQITPELLETLRQQFLGDIRQIPPMFSAVKVDGKRLYKNARSGQEVEIEPRSVHISAFELSGLRPVVSQTEAHVILPSRGAPIHLYPDYAEGIQADFRVECSKGTYIRSLVYDLGEATGSGAYLSALRRTRNGGFSVEDAWTVEALEQWIDAQ